jgi:hypothetical protein
VRAKDVYAIEKSVRTVLHLCVAESMQREVHKAGFLPVLLEIINACGDVAGTIGLQEACLHIIRMLAQRVEEVCNELFRAGGLKCMLTALKAHGDWPKVAEHGCSILTQMARGQGNIDQLFDAGVIAVVMDLFNKHTARRATMEQVLRALRVFAKPANMSADLKATQEVYDRGGITLVVQALKQHPVPSIECNGLRLLQCLARLKSEAVAEAGGAEVAITALGAHGRVGTRVGSWVLDAGVRVLRCISETPAGGKIVARSGGLQAVCTAISDESPPAVQAYGCIGVASLV